MRTKMWMDARDFAQFAENAGREIVRESRRELVESVAMSDEQAREKVAERIVDFQRAWSKEVLNHPDEYPMLAHFERAKIARARRGESVCEWGV